MKNVVPSIENRGVPVNHRISGLLVHLQEEKGKENEQERGEKERRVQKNVPHHPSPLGGAMNSPGHPLIRSTFIQRNPIAYIGW